MSSIDDPARIGTIDPLKGSKRPSAVIYSLDSTSPTLEELEFFRDADPLGFILFARNCETPEQIRRLTSDLNAALGRAAPMLIDQEGGRVRRLKPPHWSDIAAARTFGELYERDPQSGLAELRRAMRLLARELAACGLNVDCAPVLDILYQATHQAIGDRAFAGDAKAVAIMGATVCAAFLAEDIVPVIKHLPGQGRATLDSHHDLPRVDATLEEMRGTDFRTFRDVLAQPHGRRAWGMVSHIVYSAIDGDAPASCSAEVIDIIRSDIGFDGLLLSDDIGMGALSVIGDMGRRAARTLEAGCDITLHCSGKPEEMREVAAMVGPMTDRARERFNASVTRNETAQDAA